MSDTQPNFMGTPLEVMQVVRPLVSASPNCLDSCEQLYEEWKELFHESADREAGVYILFCGRNTSCSLSETCGARSLLLGRVDDNVFVPFSRPLIDNPHPQAVVDSMFSSLTQEEGADSGIDAAAWVAEITDKLDRVSHAVIQFGISNNYPSCLD